MSLILPILQRRNLLRGVGNAPFSFKGLTFLFPSRIEQLTKCVGLCMSVNLPHPTPSAPGLGCHEFERTSLDESATLSAGAG